ncbi:MAG: hypothetical protein ACHQFZ_03915 [Acidimicrobiales bacterium]
MALGAAATNLIGAEARALAGFSIGVGRGSITDGSRVAVSQSDNGASSDAEIWIGSSLQTALGFSLSFASNLSTQSPVRELSAAGRLFIATSDSSSLVALASLARKSQVLIESQQIAPRAQSLLSSGTTFNVGSDTGGQVSLNGSQLSYIDHNGTLSTYTFDPSQNVESEVNQVMNATIPPPSAAQVTQGCQGSVVSVSNSQVYVHSVDSTTSSTQKIISVQAVKSTSVNCTTMLVTTSSVLDVSGDFNGQGFQAISDSGPIPSTSTSDNGPAPTEPALVGYAPASTDEDLLPPPVEPDGTLPVVSAYNGDFNGSFSGSQTTTMTVDGVTTPGPTLPVSGSVTFSVSGDVVDVSAPGNGSGNIDLGGAIDFVTVVPPNYQGSGGSGGICHFSGTVVLNGSALSSSGSMSCGSGSLTVSASWNATSN